VTRRAMVYDPDCGFCRVCVAVVLRWDRDARLRAVALTSMEGKELLAGMPESARMASWHLVLPRWSVSGAENATDPDHLAENTVFSGGAAFSPLFRLLPSGGPLARVTDRFPEAAERAYRWVADHRSAFGKLIPDAVRRWADGVISEYGANSR
jgi:predicted DCC family thiol-disulfide oxidoreductase YuxK